MRLGNDIVDRKVDAEVHPRFLSRILHPIERTLYPGLSDPKHIWMLWAAKEAAFKAHRQGEAPVSYLIPNRWLVDFQLNRVFFGDEEYILTIEVTEDYIHATARSEDAPFRTCIHSAALELTPEASRSEARRLRTELHLTREVAKDERGVPRLDDSRPYSLTHHGRHVALAWGTPPD